MTGFELFPGVPAGGTGVIIVIIIIVAPCPESKKARFCKVFWTPGPKKSKRARFYKVFLDFGTENVKKSKAL